MVFASGASSKHGTLAARRSFDQDARAGVLVGLGLVGSGCGPGRSALRWQGWSIQAPAREEGSVYWHYDKAQSGHSTVLRVVRRRDDKPTIDPNTPPSRVSSESGG